MRINIKIGVCGDRPMRRRRDRESDQIPSKVRRGRALFFTSVTLSTRLPNSRWHRAAWPQPSRGAYVQAPPYLAPPISDSPIIPSLSRTGRRRSPEPCSQRSPLDCSRSSSAHKTRKTHLCLHQLAPPLIKWRGQQFTQHRPSRYSQGMRLYLSLSLPPPIGEHTKKKTASRGGDPA